MKNTTLFSKGFKYDGQFISEEEWNSFHDTKSPRRSDLTVGELLGNYEHIYYIGNLSKMPVELSKPLYFRNNKRHKVYLNKYIKQLPVSTYTIITYAFIN